MPVLKYHTGGGVYADLPGNIEEVTVSPTEPPVKTDLWIDTDDDTGYIPSQRLGSRNVIRNGDMSIAQRGNGPFTGNTMTVDGFQVGGGGGTRTVNRAAQASGQGAPFLQVQNAGHAGTAGEWAMLTQNIEDVETLQGRQAVLSFDAKAASGTPSIAVEVQQYFGPGGSAIVQTSMAKVQLGTTKARYVLPFAVPSVSGKTIVQPTTYLGINFWLSAGSDFAARSMGIGTQNNTFSITDVQLEEGSVATPFERLPVQQQLAWCQRYFQRIGANNPNVPWVGSGGYATVFTNPSGSGILGDMRLPATMRNSPTVQATSANTFVLDSGSGPSVCTGMGFYLMHAIGIHLNVAVASPGPAYRPWVLFQNEWTSSYIDLSAEF